MASHPQTLKLIGTDRAARAFQACAGLDPLDRATPQGMASAGACFELSMPSGRLVYCLGLDKGRAWVHAAAGQGQGMTAIGLTLIEAQARAVGCASVAFTTVRRGLVRLAEKRGYTATPLGRGHLMEKHLCTSVH